MKSAGLISILFFFFSTYAQPVFPYWDKYNNHFNIFDNGQLRTLETLPVKGYKFGNNLCAYVTDVLDFKIYTNGKSILVSKFLPKYYDCSDALVAWSSGVASYVYYDGSTRKICNNCSDLRLKDSMVAYSDQYGYFMVFYDGRTRSLELSPNVQYTLGRNLIAFEDRNNELKVFYHDTLVTLEYFSDSLKYFCGLNTVGFMDRTSRLRVFYNKRVFTLDKLRPRDFKVGDDLVAWIDQNDNFRVFHKGNVFLLEDYAPGAFDIIDGILYYRSNNNELKVFENGKGKVIENYYPTLFAGYNHTLAYVDFRNRLKAYTDGNVYNVSEDIVTSFKVYSDLIVYTSNAKSMTFWYKGDKIEVQLN